MCNNGKPPCLPAALFCVEDYDAKIKALKWKRKYISLHLKDLHFLILVVL